MHLPAVLLILSGLLLPSWALDVATLRPADVTPAEAFGFERAGAWQSVPIDLLDQMMRHGVDERALWCARPVRYLDGPASTRALDFATMAEGLTLSEQHVTQGAHSGHWADHQIYPTIMTDRVPRDWSRSTALTLSVFSQVRTDEVVTVGVLSDNPDTAEKDWYFTSFTVDWEGPRKLTLPFSAFVAQHRPAGWGAVTALGFFAKAFGHQPCPATELWLDGIALANVPTAAPAAAAPLKGCIYTHAYHEKPTPLNHAFPELPGKPPIFSPGNPSLHGPYFAYERAQWSYYPRFQPGYVSFDATGKAYVRAGDRIQWRAADGSWTFCDLGPVLAAWGTAQGWAALHNSDAPNNVEPMIRFDRDGDAYVLAQVRARDAQGKDLGFASRKGLLLHSRDGLKTWTVYEIPGGRTPNFEKLEGHNSEALDHPPVILNGDIAWSQGSDAKASLVLPVKNADGTLRFDGPYPFAENAIVGNVHSGDANQALSLAGRIYVVWGWCPMSVKYPEIVKQLNARAGSTPINIWGGGAWNWQALKDTALGATLPAIPATHAALAATYERHRNPTTAKAQDGVPMFISVFDRATRTYAPPVFLGFGGCTLDYHNFPGITADSKGYLTVVMNGHHDPLSVTRSLKPYDASAWSDPEHVNQGPTSGLSYSTLTTDRSDHLYSVNRSSAANPEEERCALGFTRRKAGASWEEERCLVWPFKQFYMAWSHRMTYDRQRDRLFLTYYCNGSGQYMPHEDREFFLFQHPDQEAKVPDKQGEARWASEAKRSKTDLVMPYLSEVNPEVSDASMLVSEDHGETWHLVTGDDLR